MDGKYVDQTVPAALCWFQVLSNLREPALVFKALENSPTNFIFLAQFKVGFSQRDVWR